MKKPGPLPDSYWVQPGRLLAGPYPGTREKRHALLAAGAAFFLDLTKEGELETKLYLLLLQREAATRRLSMVKIDLLGLRMLSALEDAIAIIEAQTGRRPDLDALPRDDPAVYEMLCRGETVGVFSRQKRGMFLQVESRAQANLIPRFQPRCFADLVIHISLIRPGAPSRLTWFTPTCAGGRGWSRSPIRTRSWSRRWKRRWG